ncbi:hypothetical protein ACFL0W_00350 [Nanoarchaeota archaeon]
MIKKPKMSSKQELKILHQPRLDTIMMIEETIKEHGGELGKFQMWRKLPKAVMYQTYLTVLDYLEYSNKIAFDKKGKVGWIFSPNIYKKFKSNSKLKR